MTALRRAAEGLPTPWCRGQDAHILALGIRVGLAYFLFHGLSSFSKASSGVGHCYLEQVGGAVIVLMASGLIINYLYGGKGGSNGKGKGNGNGSGGRRKQAQIKTSLASFLIADAFLSLDTVVAAVAMTTNFALAVTAMVSASFCIMIFHNPLHEWLKLNPRMALIAFVVIGLLGFNLILQSQGLSVPKYALLLVVFLGIWLDKLDKDRRIKRELETAEKRRKSTGHAAQSVKEKSRLVDMFKPVEVIAAEQPGSVVVAESTAFVREIDGYAFGTSHSASAKLGFAGDIVLGEAVDKISAGAGGAQAAIVSACRRCGRYQYFSPDGEASADCQCTQ